MLPPELVSLDLALEPGRPAAVRLRLRTGLELSGIRVWRTPRGPRVVYPSLPGPSSAPVFRLSRTARLAWTQAIVDSWRVAVAPASMALPVARRAAA